MEKAILDSYTFNNSYRKENLSVNNALCEIYRKKNPRISYNENEIFEILLKELCSSHASVMCWKKSGER